MKILIEKETNKPIEFIDGHPIITDTPTLLTDNATLDSCFRASKEVNDVEFDVNNYELISCVLNYNNEPIIK